jgi:hypothetical protein
MRQNDAILVIHSSFLMRFAYLSRGECRLFRWKATSRHCGSRLSALVVASVLALSAKAALDTA